MALWLWLAVALAGSDWLPVDELPLAEAAVVVGVEEYPFFPTGVRFAHDDARDVARFLDEARRIADERLHRLYQTPTAILRDDVLHALRRAAQAVGPGGRVWFYFAGHGVLLPSGRALLLPRATPSDLAGGAVLVDELRALAADADVELFLVVDACHNDRGRDGEVLFDVGRAAAVPRVAVPERAGVVLDWMAAGPGQTAHPLPPQRHGAFTSYLLQALAGEADGAPRVRRRPRGGTALPRRHRRRDRSGGA